MQKRRDSSDSDKKKTIIPLSGILKEEDYAQVLIHKRRHASNNNNMEEAGEQRNSRSMLKYNYFDSYLASSHEMASLDIQIPVLNHSRYSLDSR